MKPRALIMCTFLPSVMWRWIQGHYFTWQLISLSTQTDSHDSRQCSIPAIPICR